MAFAARSDKCSEPLQRRTEGMKKNWKMSITKMKYNKCAGWLVFVSFSETAAGRTCCFGLKGSKNFKMSLIVGTCM